MPSNPFRCQQYLPPSGNQPLSHLTQLIITKHSAWIIEQLNQDIEATTFNCFLSFPTLLSEKEIIHGFVTALNPKEASFSFFQGGSWLLSRATPSSPFVSSFSFTSVWQFRAYLSSFTVRQVLSFWFLWKRGCRLFHPNHALSPGRA